MNIVNELGTMYGLKSALAAVWAFIAGAVGHPDSAAKWLVMLMLADFALGFFRAWKCRDIRAGKLKSGAFKFFWYWLTVAVFMWVDEAVRIAVPLVPALITWPFSVCPCPSRLSGGCVDTGTRF